MNDRSPGNELPRVHTVIRVLACSAALVAAAPTYAEAQSRQSAAPQFSKLVASTAYHYLTDPAVSPDGRWVAATGSATASSALVIVSSSGGTPRELVPKSEHAIRAAWFPGGDRIAFISNRVGGIVVSDFDAATGQLRGALRRITTERAHDFGISPDGRFIAYVAETTAPGDDRVLKLVPSTGGSARVLHRAPGSPMRQPGFSEDGKHVYVTVTNPGALGTVIRIPVTGGAPTPVWAPRDRAPGVTIAEPAAGRLLRHTGGVLTVMTLTGDTVAVINGADPTGHARVFDGAILMTRSDVGTIIRAVSLDGGTDRELSPSSEYFWPLGWSSDSKRVFFRADSLRVVHSVALDGSGKRSVSFNPLQPFSDSALVQINDISADGRYWFLWQRRGAGTSPAYLYDSEARTLRSVTDSLLPGGVTFAGGRYLRFDPQTREFIYFQRTGGPASARTTLPREIMAVSMTGAKRLIRRVPSIADSARAFALHGNRIAWLQRVKDSTVLFIARGATAAPMRAWSTTGRVFDLAWSNDGQRIALTLASEPVATRERCVVVALTLNENGIAREDGRSASFGSYWDIYWSADDRSMTALEYPASDFDTRLIRIPLNGAAPSYVLKQGQFTFWDHYPSPDGKYSLIPAETPHGSSFWKVDLRAAEAAYKSARAR
jgi:WD40 repeat protein